MTDHLKEILAERGKLYGDAVQTHADIAQAWSALWRNKLKVDLSAEDVALGMVNLKLIREQRSSESGLSHVDNFDDGHNYLTIAQDCSLARPEPEALPAEPSDFEKAAWEAVHLVVDSAEQEELPAPLLYGCAYCSGTPIPGATFCQGDCSIKRTNPEAP